MFWLTWIRSHVNFLIRFICINIAFKAVFMSKKRHVKDDINMQLKLWAGNVSKKFGDRAVRFHRL